MFQLTREVRFAVNGEAIASLSSGPATVLAAIRRCWALGIT